MSVEENKQTAIKFLNAMAVGDWDTMRELMPEDGWWWVPEGAAASGVKKREELIELTGQSLSGAISPFTFTYKKMIGEGDDLAVEAESYCEYPGKTYQNKYHMLMAFENGKIKSIKEYMNTKHVYDVFG